MNNESAQTRTYHVIGIMSGSSLDGLDVAYCTFQAGNSGWSYTIEQAETYPYDAALGGKLHNLSEIQAEKLVQTDMELGRFVGQTILQFIKKYRPGKIDFIASHGHTAFHNPLKGYTSQIGSGAAIAGITGIPTITDFRSLDVSLGGQGAPLVPIGDKHLFREYDYCLNLGGYSNISYSHLGIRMAFDICPVNKIINRLAGLADNEMDVDGIMARKGIVNDALYKALNDLYFYHTPPPKSLADEWLNTQFIRILENYNYITLNDQLRTVYEHIALQIREATKRTSGGSILVTGGGAYNRFLLERIDHINSNRLIVPDDKLIEFKEALIFGFMGVLRMENKINCLSSVTGAVKDTIGGIIYQV